MGYGLQKGLLSSLSRIPSLTQNWVPPCAGEDVPLQADRSRHFPAIQRMPSAGQVGGAHHLGGRGRLAGGILGSGFPGGHALQSVDEMADESLAVTEEGGHHRRPHRSRSGVAIHGSVGIFDDGERVMPTVSVRAAAGMFVPSVEGSSMNVSTRADGPPMAVYRACAPASAGLTGSFREVMSSGLGMLGSRQSPPEIPSMHCPANAAVNEATTTAKPKRRSFDA